MVDLPYESLHRFSATIWTLWANIKIPMLLNMLTAGVLPSIAIALMKICGEMATGEYLMENWECLVFTLMIGLVLMSGQTYLMA